MEAGQGTTNERQRPAVGGPIAGQDYTREDTRWQGASTTRDWIILLIVVALHTAWMLVVFFLEPGIR